MDDKQQKDLQEAAYYIWINRGRPEGQDSEIWREAEFLFHRLKKERNTMSNVSYFANRPYASYRLSDIEANAYCVPLDIMLVGATGAGKSTTLNALLNDEKAGVGHGPDPETMEIQSYQLNKYVRLWDTPGLGDSPQNDAKHIKGISERLQENYANSVSGYKGYLIDLVLVLIDGSQRDLGSTYTLLNDVILKNIAPERVLLVVNQADMAMKGRHWQSDKPDETLEKFLDEKAISIQKRVKEATGCRIPKPLYYSAANRFNLYSLLDYIIDNMKWEGRYDDERGEFAEKSEAAAGIGVWPSFSGVLF